jgi:hypothetical protein
MHVKNFGDEVLKPMSTIFCGQACSGQAASPGLRSVPRDLQFSGEMLKPKIFVILWFAPRSLSVWGT